MSIYFNYLVFTQNTYRFLSISLVQTTNAIVMSPGRVATIPRGEEPIQSGIGIIPGWGLLSHQGRPADVLQFLEKPIISNADCARTWEGVVPIRDSQICTFAGENKGL
jgi:hypothetical protein